MRVSHDCFLNQKTNSLVIPAKAGIQAISYLNWIPAFAGMTVVGGFVDALIRFTVSKVSISTDDRAFNYA